MIPNPSPTTKKKRKIAERKFHNVNSDWLSSETVVHFHIYVYNFFSILQIELVASHAT
jgi:hypothetical protein